MRTHIKKPHIVLICVLLLTACSSNPTPTNSHQEKEAIITVNVPFPQSEELIDLVKNSISTFQTALQQESAIEIFHKNLSKAGQKDISLKTLTEVVQQFKSEKKDIRIAENTEINIDKTYPQIKGLQAKVKGSYNNESGTVTFTLLYNREEAWKLSGLEIDTEAKNKPIINK
jgi:PBP1b-binding outer membrane lipoprotein LpoB